MRRELAGRLALGVWLAALALDALAVYLLFLNRSTWNASVIDVFNNVLGILALPIAYAGVGAIIIRHQPRNRIAWICLFIGAATGLNLFLSEYAVYALVVAPGSLPAAVPIAVAQSTALFFPWVFPYGLGLLLFLFPSGNPPSRRWVPILALATLDAVVTFLVGLLMGGDISSNFRSVNLHVRNPIGVIGTSVVPWLNPLWWSLVGWLLVGAAALLVRLRRSIGVERQQAKWVVYVSLVSVAGFFLGALPIPFFPSNSGNPLFAIGVAAATFGIPIAIGISILRYRLFDIDVVISRTLTYGALAVFIALLYITIVAGFGYVIGSTGRPNLLLSLVATAIVAALFQPARKWVQGWANRLVYGQRATPYEVLSAFSNVAGSYEERDILGRTAQLLADATNAERATVWTRSDGELQARAAWPTPTGVLERVALPDGNPDADLHADRTAEIRYRGDLLGVLALKKRAGEQVTPVEDQLLRDLAGHAAPVLHNLALQDELSQRLRELSDQEQELRDSRQRIVTEQDSERRRLERNIHDGAQQHLVALAVKLRLARTMVDRDPARAVQLVRELQAETRQAQQTLAELARGIYPPILRDRGLEAALRAEAETMRLDADFATRGVHRYDLDLEGAVYFCCLEAMQNAAKHAPGARVRIELAQRGDELEFSVADAGPGFDPERHAQGSGLHNMYDRIEAMRGHLEVESAPGRGARVRGSVPIRAPVAS